MISYRSQGSGFRAQEIRKGMRPGSHWNSTLSETIGMGMWDGNPGVRHLKKGVRFAAAGTRRCLFVSCRNSANCIAEAISWTGSKRLYPA
jgi:hypothetical protein